MTRHRGLLGAIPPVKRRTEALRRNP